MFGKLKEKLKSALSIFSKKAEEEAGIITADTNNHTNRLCPPNIVADDYSSTIDIRHYTSEERAGEKVEVMEEVKVPEKKIEIKEEKKAIEEVLIKVKEKPEEPQKEKIIPEHKKEPEHKPKPEHHDKKKEEVEVEHTVEIKPTEEIKKVDEKKEEQYPEEIKEVPSEEKRGFFSKLFGKKEEEVEEEKEQQKEETIAEDKKVEEKAKEHIKEAELEEKKGFFDKLKQTLTTKTISADKFEELFWELEVALLENNVSVEVIERIKEDLKEELVNKPISRDVEKVIEDTLQRTMRDILSFDKINLLSLIKKKSKKPYVIAFFGINGSGKTTSIAKLTHYLKKNGCSVVLAACDTFRAAAIQQLEEHADKLGVKMIKHDYGSDAAAVAFDAVKYAEKNNIDVVLVDTAGRLHSNTNLMAELEKIIRVTKPDLKLFVGESITGNDCIEQAKQFNALVEMDGAILTKADVDEKGGAPLSIAYTINKPILFLGVGQNYDDLEEFDTEVMMGRLGF